MSNEQVMTDEARVNQRKGRLTMLAIVAVFVLPFFVLPLFMSPENMAKTNKGILINPHVIFSALEARNDQQQILQLPPQKKWALLYIWSSACKDACVNARNHALFALNQVPIALGRDMDRVQSLILMEDNMAPDVTAQLQQSFKSLQILRASTNAVDRAFAAALPDKASLMGNIYLMSPDGYVFIYYLPAADEKTSLVRAEDIRSDLKKSLKGSRI